jgi:hypothetical protein
MPLDLLLNEHTVVIAIGNNLLDVVEKGEMQFLALAHAFHEGV